MMKKPTGHKERYVIKSEISRSNDETCARTRPFSYDEIMLARKNKKESGSIEDQQVESEVVSGHVESDRYRHRDDDEYNKQNGIREPKKVLSREKEDTSKVTEDKIVEGEYKESNSAQQVLSEVVSGKSAEDVSGRVEPDRHRNRHRDVVGGDKQDVSDERSKVSSGIEEDRSKMRDDKIVDGEYKVSDNAHRRSKIGGDDVKDRSNERGVHEKRKHLDRSTHDFDNEREKKCDKDSAIKDRDKNVGRDRNVDRDESVGRDKIVEKDRNVERDRNIERGRNVEGGRNVGRDRNSERDRNVDRDRNVERDRNADRGRNVERDRNVDRDRNVNRDRKVERDRNVDRERNVERDKNVDGDRNVERDRNVDRDRNVERGRNVDRDRNVERNKNINRDVEGDRNVDRDRGRDVERDRNVDNIDRDKNGERDRNVERDIGKPEEVTKKRTQSVKDELDRDQDTDKKHDSRKHDSNSSEKKRKETSESRHEELKLRSKRSRSREQERDKRRRSNSPSSRGHKQRAHHVREHEDPSSHASKDRVGRFDSSADRKKLSNNGPSNKSKRHDTSASRLGGYSPRKRRSEAAVRTPSPTSRSPEKKSASSNKTAPSIKTETFPLTPFVPKPTFGVFPNMPLMMNAAVDSVQLTQATRPKRRIYVENLPSSASDADVMKWLSGYLRPSGFNLVQGPSPCISCILNKEKGQAVVEFLTPEDASTALSFDGRSFSGNIVKIRRPKDYVEATTGVSEKPVAEAVSVRNIVEDSPNKIFIGGISKVITSKMLMEIASAFGPIKAYHFEDNAHPDSPCAFVEYADQAVTVKACAGLNGMKLGGQVMTVTQATPDASSVENHGERPSYGTPSHARPLLETPTQVLKLSNVLDPHSLSTLSEPELEEILEDIRLECARFGMVKSINIIKQTNMPTSSETVKITEESKSVADEAKDDHRIETGSQSADSDKDLHEEVKQDESTSVGDTNEPEKVNGSSGDDGIVSKEHENNSVKDETDDTTMADSVVESENLENSNQISSAIDQSDLNESKLVDDVEMENRPLKPEMVSIDQPENESKPIDDIEMKTNLKPEMVPESNDNMKDVISDLNSLFELGCVLVEYKRIEASSMAAHCLHGRNFDGRTVSVEYVAPDAYSRRLHK